MFSSSSFSTQAFSPQAWLFELQPQTPVEPDPGAQGRIAPRRKTRRLWPLPVVDLEEDDLAALRATGLLKL